MFVYLLTIILCILFSLISVKSKSSESKFFQILPIICLFLVSAMRYNVGTDYSGTYTEVYYLVLNGFKHIRMDIGFLWLYKFIVFFELHLQWLFVITSFIVNIYIYKSIMEQSKDKTLSYYIYICSTFYFFSMNGIRQSITMALFYYSLKYIKQKNMWKYFFINIIGSLFHQAALIFLPVYFLVNYRFKKKSTYIIILILTFACSSIIMPILISLLKNTKYNLYFMHNNYNALSSFNLSSILNLIIFIIYIWCLDFKNIDEKDGYNYMICHFIGAELTVFLTSIPLTLRIFESFRFIDYLSIPYLINTYGKKYKSLILWIVYGFYFAYFIYHIYLNNANSVLPYTTILSLN